MSKRTTILGMIEETASRVATQQLDRYRASLQQILHDSISSVSTMDFAVSSLDTGYLSYVRISNQLNGFLWGIHTWGIHSISTREYEKIPDIPVNSIQDIL